MSIQLNPSQLPHQAPVEQRDVLAIANEHPFPKPYKEMEPLLDRVSQGPSEAQTPSFMSRMQSWFSSWFSSSQQEESNNPPSLYSNYTASSIGNSLVTTGGVAATIWGAVELSGGNPAVGGVLIGVAVIVKLVWAARVHVIITNSQSYNALAELGAKFVHKAQEAYNGLASAASQCLGKMDETLAKAEADRKETQAAIKAEVEKLQGTGETLAITANSTFELFKALSTGLQQAQLKNEQTLKALKDENTKKDLLLSSLNTSIETLKNYSQEIEGSKEAYQSLATILGSQKQQLELLDASSDVSSVVAVNTNIQTLVGTILTTLQNLQNLPQILEKLSPEMQMDQLMKIQQSVSLSTQTLADLEQMRSEVHKGLCDIRSSIEQEVSPLVSGQQDIVNKLAELNQKMTDLK